MKETKIYEAVFAICGHGELTQQITKSVSIALLAKKRRKIYDVLTNSPQSTKEISEQVDFDSRTVSSILLQMKRKTTLIASSTSEKGKILWVKL